MEILAQRQVLLKCFCKAILDSSVVACITCGMEGRTIKGLMARGNFVIDMQWKNAKLLKADILSKAGGACVLRTTVPVRIEGAIAKSQKLAFIIKALYNHI